MAPTAGEGMMLFGDQMMNIAAQQRAQEVHQENTALMTQKEVDLANSANNMVINWKNSDYGGLIDTETLDDRGKNQTQNFVDQEKDKINAIRTNNPYLADRFDALLAHTEILLNNHYNDIKNVKLKEYNLSQLQSFMNDQSAFVQSNPDEQAVDNSIKNVHGKIDELVSNGTVGADHAMALGQHFYKDVGERLIVTHPAGADLFFAKYKDEFNPVLLKQFNDQLKQVQKRDEVTQTLIDLKTRYIDNNEESAYGKGILGALNEVESSDFMKAHGEEVTRIVQSSMITQWRRQEEAYKAASDEITGKLLVKIENGNVTKDDIFNSGLRTSDQARAFSWWNTKLRSDRGEMRASLAEGRAARMEQKQLTQEKSEAIAGSIYTKLANGDDVSVQDIYDQIPSGLLPTTARGIAGDLTKLQKDPAMKDAIKVIDAFAKARGFDSDATKNLVGRGNAINDLMTAQKEEKLTGKALIDRAEQIVTPMKSNWLKNVLNSMFYTGGYLDRIGGELKSPSPPVIIRTATNPKTGEKVGLTEEGKWIPVK